MNIVLETVRKAIFLCSRKKKTVSKFSLQLLRKADLISDEVGYLAKEICQ